MHKARVYPSTHMLQGVCAAQPQPHHPNFLLLLLSPAYCWPPFAVQVRSISMKNTCKTGTALERREGMSFQYFMGGNRNGLVTPQFSYSLEFLLYNLLNPTPTPHTHAHAMFKHMLCSFICVQCMLSVQYLVWEIFTFFVPQIQFCYHSPKTVPYQAPKEWQISFHHFYHIFFHI